MYSSPTPPQRGVPTNEVAQKTLTYSSHLLRHGIKPRPHQDLGEDGYGNYGYIPVNGRWVDPDGEIDISNAVKERGPLNPPGLRVGNMPIPGKYEEVMYQEFLAEVNEFPFSDGEGDPRGLRITPAIFARMAAGCATGDKYETKKVPVQVSYHF